MAADKKIKKMILILIISYIIFSLIYLAFTITSLPRDVKYIILDSMYLLPAMLALMGSTVAFIVARKRYKIFEYVKFWFYLFSANLLLFAGELVWVFYEVVKDMETPPFPSVADYLFLSSYIFFFAIILSLI